MHYDVDGRFQLRYSAPAPVGALVEQALKEAKDALFMAASGPTESGALGQAAETGQTPAGPLTHAPAPIISRRRTDPVTPTRSRSSRSGPFPR